jgi:hypothetical protein
VIPGGSACRRCVVIERPGAVAASLRLIVEKTLSIKRTRCVQPAWASLAHLGPHAFEFPVCAATFGGYDTLGTKHLAEVLMVAFTVKLRVRQLPGPACQ